MKPDNWKRYKAMMEAINEFTGALDDDENFHMIVVMGVPDNEHIAVTSMAYGRPDVLTAAMMMAAKDSPPIDQIIGGLRPIDATTETPVVPISWGASGDA